MKKILISMALFLSVGSIMGQVDKAALKALQKEAKAQMAEAQKINEALVAKINDKSATEDLIMTECKKGQALVRKAIKGGGLDASKIGEAYKLSADMANQVNNILLKKSSSLKEPIDTMLFLSNLNSLTSALQGEIQNTKVTKGEAGNENYLKNRKYNLAKSGDLYLYAAQLMSESNKYDKALEAFDKAMNYSTIFPEVADQVELSVPADQIAYYAYLTAYEGKVYDKMDALYDQAVKFQDGAQGVIQRRAVSYLERKDSVGWENFVRELTISNPKDNEDFIQNLIGHYLKKDKEAGPDSNLLLPYIDEVLAKDPNIYIAQYGKAYKYFDSEKYDEAFEAYKKCTEIKDDSYEAWYQCGFSLYRKALGLNAKVSSIKNQTEAKKTLEQVKSIMGEAIPYFEKARELAPDEPQKWAYELKQCYSVTGQAAKAAEMDKLL